MYEAYGIGGTMPFYTKLIEYIQIDTLKVEQVEVDVGILPKLNTPIKNTLIPQRIEGICSL